MTLPILTFKWARPDFGHQIPHVCDYTSDHVNIWARMIKRHTTLPVEPICITDDPLGITECETFPMWPLLPGGGCYHRLWLFDEATAKMFGDRIMWMDLDCVIYDNIDHIIDSECDFAINRHMGDGPNCRNQHYNGALGIMNAGARQEVWDKFDPAASLIWLHENRKQQKLVGTDQAWIAYVLGRGEKTFGPEDGVYECLRVQEPPTNGCIVMFAGARHPAVRNLPFLEEHYH